MSDFRQPFGFEDVWRGLGSRIIRPGAVGRSPDGRLTTALNGRASSRALIKPAAVQDSSTGGLDRARLARIVGKAPEVVVAITGAARSPKGLKAHLEYITRKGELEARGGEGERILGREAVAEVAEEWSWKAGADFQARDISPISRSMVLSMPWGADAKAVQLASLDFATETFAGRFEYVAAFHEDGANPHTHLTVRALGLRGQRFNIYMSDLHTWRQSFAASLRTHGVDAEATLRSVRGVTLKSEHRDVRRIRLRHEAGDGPQPAVLKAAYDDAIELAHSGEAEPTPWERSLIAQQKRIREHYLNAADAFSRSNHPGDRELADKVREFVRTMPEMETQRHRMARELRTAFDAAQERRLVEIRSGLGKGPMANDRGREPER